MGGLDLAVVDFGTHFFSKSGVHFFPKVVPVLEPNVVPIPIGLEVRSDAQLGTSSRGQGANSLEIPLKNPTVPILGTRKYRSW